MTYKIQGEAPFQVLATNFSLGPSNEGYTLQVSADGNDWSDLFTVGANTTRMVTGVANGSFYRMSGNNSEVSVNWRTQCNDGGSGGGSGSQGPMGPQGPQGPAGSGAYRIELSTSNPDDFTETDTANLNAFFAAVEADPSIIVGSYVCVGEDSIYRYAAGFYDSENAGGEFDYVFANNSVVEWLGFAFEDGEYTETYKDDNYFESLIPNTEFPANPVEGQITNYDDDEGNIGLYRYDGEDWQPYGGGGSGVVYVSHLSDTEAVAAPVGTLIVLNEEEDDYQEHSIYIKVEGGEIASVKGYRSQYQEEPFEIVYDELEEFINFCDGKLMFTVNYNGARYAYMDAENLAIVYYSDSAKTTELARLVYGGTARFGTSSSSRYVDLIWEDNVIYFRKASGLESVTDIISFSTEGVHYHRITDNTKATAQNLGLGSTFDYGIPEWNNEGIIVRKKADWQIAGNSYVNTTGTSYTNRTNFVYSGQYHFPERIWVPTTGGSQGQILTSNGDDAAPVWATMIKAVKITSTDYDDLTDKDPNTLYLIVDE